MENSQNEVLALQEMEFNNQDMQACTKTATITTITAFFSTLSIGCM